MLEGQQDLARVEDKVLGIQLSHVMPVALTFED
jgi:hypothetical protein